MKVEEEADPEARHRAERTSRRESRAQLISRTARFKLGEPNVFSWFYVPMALLDLMHKESKKSV